MLRLTLKGGASDLRGTAFQGRRTLGTGSNLQCLGSRGQALEGMDFQPPNLNHSSSCTTLSQKKKKNSSIPKHLHSSLKFELLANILDL